MNHGARKTIGTILGDLSANTLQIILFIIGVPFFIIDMIYKNRASKFVINKINKWEDLLNWWGNK